MDKLASNIGSFVEDSVRRVLSLAAKVPGSSYIGRYIEKSHQNDPGRTIFEIILFVFALRYFLASKQSYSKRDYLKLSEQEIDELCAEWEPVPLVKPLDKSLKLLNEEIADIQKVESPYAYMRDGERLFNLSSTDVYGHSTNPDVKRLAQETVRGYGVGSCGPAGFYGNEDAHIYCEQSLARFLGTERCILYSQGVSTAPSVIPCFAKRGDVLVVDDSVNMAIQRGLQLSRAKVLFFVHNDMEDLEAQLVKAKALHRGKLPRRYIVTEGLFEYSGDSPNLRAIVELKHKHKFRIILDESWSLGVLGAHGRGLCEEQQVPRSEIDVTVGSLATAMGTSGGFCAGSECIVEHQRIVSLAYTFSATEPPYLARATSQIADWMHEGELDSRIANLRAKAKKFTKLLGRAKHIEVISRSDSPMVIFRVMGGDTDDEDNEEQANVIHDVVMLARERGLLISRLAQIEEFEAFGTVNAIKLFLPEVATDKQLASVASTLTEIAKEVSNK